MKKVGAVYEEFRKKQDADYISDFDRAIEKYLKGGGSTVTETFDIAGYTRISVDDELDRDNVSIENQKAIIQDFVAHKFPGSTLTFYEDRDRSGYTFEQREGYQAMRRGLMSHQYDILVVKDFSPLLPAQQPGAGGAGGSSGRRGADHLHWGQHRFSQ